MNVTATKLYLLTVDQIALVAKNASRQFMHGANKRLFRHLSHRKKKEHECIIQFLSLFHQFSLILSVNEARPAGGPVSGTESGTSDRVACLLAPAPACVTWSSSCIYLPVQIDLSYTYAAARQWFVLENFGYISICDK